MFEITAVYYADQYTKAVHWRVSGSYSRSEIEMYYADQLWNTKLYCQDSYVQPN